MLIPYNKYLLCDDLIKDFDILRKYCKSQIFVIDGVDYSIDNLLIKNIIWNGNCGKTETNEYNPIINRLTYYADGIEEYQYFSENDRVWYDNTITNLCRGFNHIKNYYKLRNSTQYKGKPIEIIEGFLVLENNIY